MSIRLSTEAPRPRCARAHLFGSLLALIAAAAGTGLALAQPAGAPTAAAAAAPIPAETFFQYPTLQGATLSPTGRRLAFTTSRGATRQGLYVLELEGQLRLNRIAQFADVDVVSVRWSSDDRLLFSLTDLQAGLTDRQQGARAPGLVAIKADGSEMTQLINHRETAVMVQGMARTQMLNALHSLLMVPRQQPGVTPDEVVIGRFAQRAGERFNVQPMWLNVATGRVRNMDTGDAPVESVRWWFNSKGEPQASTLEDRGRTEYWARSPVNGKWQPIAQGDSLTMPFSVHSVDDAGNLYVTRPDGPAGYDVLSRFDWAKMAPEAEPVVRTPGFDFSGGLVVSAADGKPVGVRFTMDATDTLWFSPAMKEAQAEIDRRLPGRVNLIDCRRCGTPEMVATVRSYSDRDPGEVWLYQAASKRMQPLMRVMEGLDARRMAKVEFHRFKARDGREIPVWVTLPAGAAPGARLPAVVMVHGGPWVRGGEWSWDAMDQFLASRGYVVIAPEFRGSTGYGDAHFRAGFKQWGQAMQDDVNDALAWAREKGVASSRACIMGASYGGYSTLIGLARDPDLWRCGVAWVAVADLGMLVRGSWTIPDDVGYSRRFGIPRMVADPKTDEAMIRANSPVEQADKIKAPLLLAMGEDDIRVPLPHGTRMRDAMTKAGKPVEWVLYPNEGHGWRKPENRLDWARRVERFLAQHLGGPATP